MTAGELVSGLGGLLLLGGLGYGVYLVHGDRWLAEERLQAARLAWHRRAIRGGLPRWLPRRWVESGSEADPVAIGCHASLVEGYDEGHAARIADICRRLARAIDLSADMEASLIEAAYLHDGGIEDWDLDLLAPGPLSAIDAARLSEHCARGENLARENTIDPMVPAWVRWHHERFDGSGYPDALEAREIPLPAQILGLADTYEAMVHSRPHRPALEPRDALAELQRLAGLHFDPELVGCFVQDVYPDLVGAENPASTRSAPAE